MSHIAKPSFGSKISFSSGRMQVPDFPVVPFIEGDGIGIDISPVMKSVVDAAVHHAYGAKRKIDWLEIYAGEKANNIYGDDIWPVSYTHLRAHET